MIFDKCMKILSCIQKSPKSVKEISTETNIPITTVYRIIRIFEDHNMLLMKGDIATAKYRLFQSKGSMDVLGEKLHEIF